MVVGARDARLEGQHRDEMGREDTRAVEIAATTSQFRRVRPALLAWRSRRIAVSAAIAQIAPAFLGGLIWSRGTALGASVGLVVGLLLHTGDRSTAAAVALAVGQAVVAGAVGYFLARDGQKTR